MFSYAVANGSPAVVVTEGINDVEFLKAAIEIRKPHLARFVRFFDFDFGPQGGAGTAINTVKAFAAAGINNRVIVLLDNDTAAREARRGLRGTVPGHYLIAHYPHLDVAESYPTDGPTGRQPTDVNGLAGSIELYLGRDVLTLPDTGELTPLRWGAHIRALGAYQGEVTDKRRIHEAFRAKVVAARAAPSLVARQDWSGLDAIIDSLLEHLRSCGVTNPGTWDAAGPAVSRLTAPGTLATSATSGLPL